MFSLEKGYFITFEGIDGCGKSTQANNLVRSLKNKGYETVFTREPGATVIGKEVRKLALSNQFDPCLECEVLLFQADRAEHVSKVIRPNLEEGKIVVCDRYFDSTLAYQRYGRNVNVDFLVQAHDFSTRSLYPDLTFLFDLDLEVAFERIGDRRDRMENEDLEFFERVRQGFLEIAKAYPQRVKVIDGSKNIEEIFREVCLSTYDCLS
ncbi:dTMP kinase [archaeon]|nr:dTMP kinase [archaeon]|tara:strand:- start:4018 stop:4641 length:624 start_codon:yes stop_codon:yes gene_type:complete